MRRLIYKKQDGIIKKAQSTPLYGHSETINNEASKEIIYIRRALIQKAKQKSIQSS